MMEWSITAWLRRRLLVLVAGLWIAAAVIAVYVGTSETNEVFDNALESAADVVSVLAPGDPGSITPSAAVKIEEVALPDGRKDYVTYQIRSNEGRVIHRSTRAPSEPYLAAAAPGFSNIGSVRFFTKPLVNGLIVQVSEEPTERRQELVRLVVTFLLPLLALLAAAFFIATRLARNVGSSLVSVAEQVRLRGGQSLEPLDRAGLPLELQPFVDDVNHLLDRLKRALEAERSFSANCAHELRNPIAAARAQADLAAERLIGNAEHGRLSQLSEALTRLGRYTERLLQMNRAEAGFSRSGQTCDLVDVTRRTVDEYARRPGSANRLDFDDAGLAQLEVVIDRDALAIAISNLIDNALAYSNPDSEVQIVLDPSAELRVVNEADAIPPEQLIRLLRRFERGTGERHAGFGLGLSIVQQIVGETGGVLELTSPVPGHGQGFQAALRLRRAANLPL